ncbi:glycerophosphodiester phosphodiesterase [Chryseomicrobium sp. FSL W7-1435]|uniref:glycerophosphodiester phosphodiesterase n=1 Tax=Chryseomicrobium sp. FSL W7-1435 TaxID=2921704 RepID=UPI003159C64A
MKIFAHRGCSGAYPENTLAAFRAASELPIEGIELDVHLTKDGELVVIHDELVDRTTDGTGFVKDMTIDQLRLLDAGSWKGSRFEGERIPFLSEVLELFTETQHILNIELKSDIFPYPGMADKVMALVQFMELEERAILSSFDHEVVRYLSSEYPHIQTGCLTMEVMVDFPDYLKKLSASAAHVLFPTALRQMGQELKAAGIPIRAFTVNDESYADLLAQAGVEAIFTDYPERFIQQKSVSSLE